MKKIIITGAPRTGATVLCNLLSHSPKILITDELATFDHDRDHYIRRSETWVHTSKITKRALENKHLTLEDINSFLAGGFRNKGNLEFFGDKFPTYCFDRVYCSHLATKHSDAYYIFTYRNPFATIYSGKKRTEVDKNEKADWFFKSIEESTEKFKKFVSNWSGHIYPHVENKIIIDYDKYVNNVDLLMRDLSVFLGISLDLPAAQEIVGTSLRVDVGYEESRGVYNNSKLEAYKEGLSKKEIEYIALNTETLDLYIRDLISKQQKTN